MSDCGCGGGWSQEYDPYVGSKHAEWCVMYVGELQAEVERLREEVNATCRAQAALARVRALCDDGPHWVPAYGTYYVDRAKLRAAIEGDNQ